MWFSTDTLNLLASRLACLVLFVHGVTAQNSILTSTTFDNTRRFLFDTDGNQVDAYGSKVNLFNGTYYLYGNSFSIRGAAFGIKSYSSSDLATWKYEGYLFDPSVPNPCDDVGGCGRPHIVYNAQNDQYILWANAGNPGYVVATSSSPTGPFDFVGRSDLDPQFASLQPADFAVESYGDKAYLVFSALNFRYAAAGSLWPPIQQSLHISELASDFLNVSTTSYNVSSATFDLIDQEAESPDLFIHNGTFYVGASNTCGYCNGSIALIYRSDSITGPWTRQIVAGDGCNSQFEGVLPLPQSSTSTSNASGEDTTYVWHGTSVPGGPRTGFTGHIFQPLQFNPDGSVQDLDCTPDARFPVSFLPGTNSTPTTNTTSTSPSPPDAAYSAVCDSDEFTLIQTWQSPTTGALRRVSVNIAAAPQQQLVPLTLTVFTFSNNSALQQPGYVWRELGNATYNATQLSYVFDAVSVVFDGDGDGDEVRVAAGDMLGIEIAGPDFLPYCHLEYDDDDDFVDDPVVAETRVLLQQGTGQNSWHGRDGRTGVVYPRLGRGLRFFAVVDSDSD